MEPFSTPVLFILFNRTDTALQVFETIRQAKPPRLYFFADGARENVNGEYEQCQEARAIAHKVDWDCEVQTLFLAENIGPRLALGKAINWFFEHEEEGIILEHDCLPSASFYTFCQSLLQHYRTDERIMHISGNNFQFGQQRGGASYYFSRYNHIWGFATWRRAWKHYDEKMELYPQFVAEKGIENLFKQKRIQYYWRNILGETYTGNIQTWDYQWAFAMWHQNGLAILPQQNLVSNIGFDSLALNTYDTNSKYANVKRHEILAIQHPTFVLINEKADDYTINEVFYQSYIKRVWNKITRKLINQQ